MYCFSIAELCFFVYPAAVVPRLGGATIGVNDAVLFHG